MQRITVSLDDEIVALLDTLLQRRGATNRSEAVRDMVREAVARDRLDMADDSNEACVATLSYVYDHERRDLNRRLTDAHHHRHDLSVATLHVHLDHDTCLEVTVLTGPLNDVRGFADAISNQRGVRHGHLHVLPARIAHDHHGHGDGSDTGSGHSHIVV